MNRNNVLLITVDSLRYDRIHNSPRSDSLTPNIDKISEESTDFCQAVSNGPNTPSSFPSILTSCLPMMYGGYRFLNDNRPFIARTLNKHEFTTVGFHSNPHLGSEKNYDVGFDTFNDSAEGTDSVASLKDKVERRLDPDSAVYSLLRRVWHYFTFTTNTSAYAKASSISENALDWFNERWNDDDPFFMWLHYMDVHYPFAPPERFLDELDIDPLSTSRIAELNSKMQEEPDDLTDQDVEDLYKLYDGEIRFTDHYIGKVLDHLKQRDVLDETIIIITADHGEAFGEHGRFGHHPYLYDELLRVPLIIHAPGAESRTVDQQVSLLDLGPTLYDLLDIEIPDAVQGTSLKPLLKGEEMDEEIAIITGRGGKMLACRTSDWKCFWKVETDQIELYNLQSDPEELEDVSNKHQDVVAEFRKTMQEYLDEAEKTDIDLPDIEESTEVQQRLRDLGYVD